jgi:uncharacterized damage-inducible protein DinB
MKFKWSLEKLQEEANKFDAPGEFSKKSPSAYVTARTRGVLKQICGHMKRSIKSWTNEMLQEEALKYNSLGNFQKYSHSAYQTAYSRGILKQICSHMIQKYVQWTNEMVQEEALKYETYGDFKKNSLAYDIAIIRKILCQVTKHMKKHGDVSSQEQYLLDKIKDVWPKAQRLRDRKVKIEGKPHITGFDLDIYVPELRKAIEFDGEYWHSEAGLKRSRSHWPQEDINNYHQLKDDHFAIKGIQVLHIKEEDWVTNKEVCIQKCLNFLSSN